MEAVMCFSLWNHAAFDQIHILDFALKSGWPVGFRMISPFSLRSQAMKSHPGPTLLTRRACCVASMPRTQVGVISMARKSPLAVQCCTFKWENQWENQ